MPGTVIRRRALLSAIGAAVVFIPAMPASCRRAKHRAGASERIVALDPGHGGIDPGAVSADRVYEKKITLATAAELARQLAGEGRFRPVLTRSRDVYVGLRERVARARRHHAELLLSIHADALPDAESHGLSVYTLSDQASDRETAALAARENRENFVEGVPLSREPPEIGTILLDLARRQTNNRSLIAAQAIVSQLGRTVALLEKPQRSAGFVVLTAPDVPSVLVEIGCLSNPREQRLLQLASYRQHLAQGLVRAIDEYFTVYG